MFEAIHYMLKHKVPVDTPNSSNATAMCVAIKHSCVNVIELLINHGADINKESKYGTSLKCAVSFAGAKVVKLISDNGKFSSDDLEILAQACLHTTGLDVVKFFVGKQKVGGDWIAYTSPNKASLFERACCNKNPKARREIFRYLVGILKENYTETLGRKLFNKKNGVGCTTIMYVARYLEVSDVKTIVSMGADPFAKSRPSGKAHHNKATALDYAIQYQNISSDTNTISFFLNLGCEPKYNIDLSDPDANNKDIVSPSKCLTTSIWATQRKLDKLKKEKRELQKLNSPEKESLSSAPPGKDEQSLQNHILQ